MLMTRSHKYHQRPEGRVGSTCTKKFILYSTHEIVYDDSCLEHLGSAPDPEGRRMTYGVFKETPLLKLTVRPI